MEFKYKPAPETLTRSEMVLVDDSVLTRFYDRRRRKPVKFYEYERDMISAI
jgi:hypothetical protein